MKLGSMNVPLSGMPFDAAMEYLASIGVEAVEIGCGGFPGNAHCDPEVLLNNEAELEKFKAVLEKNGLVISALSCHGNPVHPNKEIAEKADREFRNAVLLAEKLGVKVVNTFSGCPGDCPESQYPNWVTCPWPDDFGKILDYQWNEVLIPYWKEMAKFLNTHGVKAAFEMHPGFCVYGPESLLKIRDAVGDAVGANFDPSHLFWQGIDIPTAILQLKGAIYNFHAKDCYINPITTAKTGVLDVKPYSDEINRSWLFRTMGYGHDVAEWKQIVSTLRLCGFDGTLAIEHEDSLMSVKEGLEKAVSFLKEIIIREEPAQMWWA